MVYNVCVYIKKKKRTQLYRIRNEVSGVDLVSPFLHVLGRSLFVQVGYQMEKLYVTDVDLQKKVEIKIQSTLVVFCALLSVFFYQTRWIAGGHDKVHEDGQVSMVHPQFGQGFEHAIVVDLTLIRRRTGGSKCYVRI